METLTNLEKCFFENYDAELPNIKKCLSGNRKFKTLVDKKSRKRTAMNKRSDWDDNYDYGSDYYSKNANDVNTRATDNDELEKKGLVKMFSTRNVGAALK